VDTAVGKGLLGRDLARVIRRSPGPGTPPKPSPPGFLGPLRAGATHLYGDVWEVPITGLGLSPVGPYDQLKAYLRAFNQNRPPGVEPMVSAHIIGGEHIRDLGWDMPYDKAPCIGVAESLHDKWTGEINSHQSQAGLMGGRTTATAGRTIVGPDVVKALHHEVYRGFPELQEMALRIVNQEARRIMGGKYGMPAPKSPMDAHESGMPAASKSPMDAHQGGMPPASKSPMDAHQGGMPPASKSPMDAHQGGMPVPTSVPEPEPGFWSRRLSAAKSGIGAGLKAAVSAEGIAAIIPDVILAVADRVATREAIRTIVIKFTKEGFAKGVAAGVTGWSEEEVASDLKNRVTPFRVQGLEDPAGILTRTHILQLAEASENHAVDVGHQFSSAKTLKWKKDLLDEGLARLSRYRYDFGDDPQFLFRYDFIDKLAWALRTTTNPMVDAALEKSQERREAELAKTVGIGR
jgi:hypothetical protein